MTKLKGAVAAGHSLTAKTAESILKEGGNAFDAAVGAQFTALVVEPVLTSLGGGGFLFAEKDTGKQEVYDFFVQTPIKKSKAENLDFHPISADFGETKQEYRIGAGAVAVPGLVKGLFDIHRNLCSFPIKRLAEEAIYLARNGVKMNSFQSGIFEVVKPIYESSDSAFDIFKSKASPGDVINEGETLIQPDLGNTLEMLVKDGCQEFYEGEIAESVVSVTEEPHGHLSRRDFESYRVIHREPLKLKYKGNSIALNPPPGSGGLLIAFSLKLLESLGGDVPKFGSRDHIIQLAEIQRMTDSARVESLVEHKIKMDESLLDKKFLNLYKDQILERVKAFKGTTQISVADGYGNKASLTSSNGEGSGIIIPGTGIMLNNMLGEEDLNPGGFHQWKPDSRVSSMMTPGVLKMKNNKTIVFGSGGSNRIRSAILQLILNITDHEMSLSDAVNAPRVHFERGKLNAEGGIDFESVSQLESRYPDQKIWMNKSLFFGGAHSVCVDGKRYSGVGDTRRGGASLVL